MSSDKMTVFCGCTYVKAGEVWWQVVACPDHEMDMAPVGYPPRPRVREAGR